MLITIKEKHVEPQKKLLSLSNVLQTFLFLLRGNQEKRLFPLLALVCTV